MLFRSVLDVLCWSYSVRHGGESNITPPVSRFHVQLDANDVFLKQAAAILAAGLQDWVDFGVICALLLLNACVGFVQEFQAGSIVEELKKTLALKAVVLRDGNLYEIEASQVVPGDILQIEEVCTLLLHNFKCVTLTK